MVLQTYYKLSVFGWGGGSVEGGLTWGSPLIISWAFYNIGCLRLALKNWHKSLKRCIAEYRSVECFYGLQG